MQIEYSKQAVKFLKKLQKPVREKIVSAIKRLPYGDVVRYEGFESTYRLRVGSYRVIYSRQGNIIKIEKIGPRGDVYK